MAEQVTVKCAHKRLTTLVHKAQCENVRDFRKIGQEPFLSLGRFLHVSESVEKKF